MRALAFRPTGRSSGPGPLAPLVVAAGVLLVAAPARAYDLEIDSETIGQLYQIATPSALIGRQRLDQYLGLHAYNFGPTDGTGAPRSRNQLYFTMSLRLEHDFGDYPPPRDRAEQQLLGNRNVSGELGNDRLEVLYAYLGARDVLGLLDLRLGRQLDVDLFDWVSYDGLSVEAHTPWHVAAEVYAGAATNGALGGALGAPIDSPVYRTDGTAASALSPHETDWKPTVGAIVRAFGLRDLDARVSYRLTLSPAQHTTPDEAAAGAGSGTSEEKVGVSARGRLLDGRLVPWAGLRYDLLAGVIDVIQAGARFTLSERHAFQLEYVYSFPTFDGDSIWNLFVRREFDDVRLGYDLRLGRLRAYARALARLFHDGDETVSAVDKTTAITGCRADDTLCKIDLGGTLGARVDGERGYVRADLYYEGGYGGTRGGVDLAARARLFGDVLAAEGRLTYAHFADDLRPVDSGDSFGVQLGLRYEVARGILLHVIAEDNVNRFYASQLRLYALLDLSFRLGRAGFSGMTSSGVGPGMGQFGSPLGTGRGY